MLRYQLRSANQAAFPRPDDMPEALYALLTARGIASEQEAEAFLNPGIHSLHDPFLLNDMAKAVAYIKTAVARRETICVYGDYDVDGVCASAILSGYLRDQGADARVYLPSRHNEGYGLNEGAVREIAGWAKLMVTVDCGVTSVELVALAQSLGLDVIVTDHHRTAERLPDCPVVNPLLNGYPFPYLCGAGVAWKVVQALSGEPAMDRVDIAALATVADVVSLTGENRAIVRMGLEAINRAPRLGIAALIDAAGLSGKRITSTSVGFQLAPRLNAGGRLGSAMRSFDLMTAKSADKARELAEALDAENSARKQIEQQILKEAEAQLSDFDFPAHRALILAGKDWNPGVIGLAASRLVEKYHYPVVMLADQGDHMTGSCRSIEGVDIHAALTGCAEHIVRFGGHKQAAGLTLLPEKLEDFRRAMDTWLAENVDPAVYIPVESYDARIGLGAVTPGLIAALEDLQPTGFGNPGAVFRVLAEVVEARPVGAEGAHLKLMLAQGGHRLGGIAFREGPRAERLADSVDVLFTPKLNTYMGRTEAQLEVRALADPDGIAQIRAKVAREAALQCDFLTEVFYNKKINHYAGRPETVDIAAAGERLAAHPQGTLVVCADFAMAEALLRQWPQARPDVYIGELPQDRRAFNALCVFPPRAVPPGYRRVLLAGMPAEWLPGDAAEEVARLPEKPEWLRQMPDIDGLRACYKALMRLSARPAYCAGPRQLARMAAEESGLSDPAALAAILAMADLGLFAFDFSARPARIARVGAKKVEPENGAVWRTLQDWRLGE